MTEKRSNTPWPQARVDELKKLWAAGYSASLIGERLGLSRNAVLGKLDRIRQRTGDRRVPTERKFKPAVPRAPAVAKPNPLRPKKSKLAVWLEKNALQQDDVRKRPEPVEVLNMPLADIGYRHCKWICGEGEGGLALYCGHPAHNESSWCKAHYRIVYRPPVSKTPDPVQKARAA